MELLIGPISLVGGLLLGSWLNQRSERERRREARADEEARRQADRADETARWFRDNRLKMYADVLAAVRAFQDLASELDSVDYTPDEALAARKQLIQAVNRIGSATAVLPIVAPRAAALIAAEVEVMCISTIGSVTDNVPLQGTLGRQRAWLTLGRWTGAITLAAQADLAGHPIEQVPLDLPTTENWTKGQGWNNPAMRDADIG